MASIAERLEKQNTQPGLKRLNVTSKGPGNEKILENIKANIDRDVKVLHGLLPINSERLNFAAGGPSLKKKLSALKKRQKRGEKIFTVNGTQDYLIKNGIIPFATVFVDTSEIIADIFTPDKRVKYYVASMCHPKVFEKLEGHDVTMWHAQHNIGERDIIGDVLMVGGGCTVGLRSINLAFTLGFRDFHLYGYDSSFDGKRHAYDQQVDNNKIDIVCKDRTFSTTLDMAAQAQDFQNLILNHGHLFKLQTHGDGLLPYLHKHIGENNAS
jgi:hypothetical protein